MAERGSIACGESRPVDLWLMLLDEDSTAFKLGSDDAEAWVKKSACERLPNGQFRMPISVAVAAGIERGAT